MRRLWLCLTLLMVASLTPPATASQLAPVQAASALYGVNLIVNGDAEAGPGTLDNGVQEPVPGWTTNEGFNVIQYGAPGGFPAASDPGPSDRGKNFFGGGPNNAASEARQVIDVGQISEAIDNGDVRYTLSGYLGGYSVQNDLAAFNAYFEQDNTNPVPILAGDPGTGAGIGPVTVNSRGGTTALLFRTSSGLVPPGTRSIIAMIFMLRADPPDGPNNDGYADNLSLVLTNRAGTATPTATMTVMATPTPTVAPMLPTATLTASPTVTATSAPPTSTATTPPATATPTPASQVQPPGTMGAVMLLQPPDNGRLGGKTLTFQWKAYPKASFYLIHIWQVRLTSDLPLKGPLSLNSTIRVTGIQYKLNVVPLPRGAYLWNVAAAGVNRVVITHRTMSRHFSLL